MKGAGLRQIKCNMTFNMAQTFLLLYGITNKKTVKLMQINTKIYPTESRSNNSGSIP